MHAFDNLSLVLSVSKVQQQVRAKVAARQDTQETKEDAQTVEERLRQMDPKELQKLKSQIPPIRK